jgi:hypothetical protein
VLGLVALVDGYDGSMTGTLLVLAKKPLHIDLPIKGARRISVT